MVSDIGKASLLKILLLIIFILAVFLFLFLVVLEVIYFHLIHKDEIVKKLYEYQYLEINPGTIESNAGFITSYESSIGKDGFRTYEDDEGNINIMSNVGLTEYQCHGTCYCRNSDFNFRRNAAGVSLKYFLAASSVAAAFVVAKDYFQKECSNMSREKSPLEKANDFLKCPDDEIEAFINDCDEPPMKFPIDREKWDNTPIDETTQDFTEEDMKHIREGVSIYLCRGNCMRTFFPETRLGCGDEGFKEEEGKFQRVLSILQKEADTVDCGSMEFASEVVIDEHEKEGQNEFGDRFYADVTERAIHDFQEWELHAFCEKNSERTVRLGTIEKPEYKDYMDVTESMCTGYFANDELKLNPTVRCRKRFESTSTDEVIMGEETLDPEIGRPLDEIDDQYVLDDYEEKYPDDSNINLDRLDKLEEEQVEKAEKIFEEEEKEEEDDDDEKQRTLF